jgi:GDP-L-fucose synthase
MITKKTKIFIAGHEGFIGRAIVKKFFELGYENVLTQSRERLDLLDSRKVFCYFKKKKPGCVIIAAAVTGGINFNQKNKSNILYKNLIIQNNLIEAARLSKIKDLIFLASNCIYSNSSKQPWKEKDILAGPLNKEHESFSLTKIIGIKLCEYYNLEYKTNFKTLILPNIYGPGDKYNSSSSFFADFLNKIYIAKKKNKKKIFFNNAGWIKREILFVEDVAYACVFFLKKKTTHFTINIGSRIEMSLRQYATLIMEKIDFKPKIKFTKKSFGMARKILNCKIARNYGWRPKFNIELGLKKTLKDFQNKIDSKHI